MKRLTFTGLALALLLAAGAGTPARADVDININLGYGGFYGPNISCREGAYIVAQRFNKVSIQSCLGGKYDYSGKRNGKWYWIKVSRYTGRIVEVRRWYR